MPNTLGDWLRKRLYSSKRKGASSESRMPFLPPQRLHVLSPSPSRESTIASTAAATANSPFFQRLPAELRRDILIEAFGDRTIHMNLSFDHPMICMPEQEKRMLGEKIRHCGLNCESHKLLKSPLKLDVSKPKAWQWFSCVCHRDPESIVRGSGHVLEPWEDECLAGVAGWCQGWPGKAPEKCFLGAMGWLLTCRQAFIDGIDILYATNTIHMSSSVMIRHLSHLLPQQRLASITSVEMVWRLNEISRPAQAQDPPNFGKEAFEALLQAVPLALPNLRKLYICIFGPIYPPKMATDDPGRRPEADILMPVDRLAHALGPQLQQLDLALPVTIFEPLFHDGLRKGYRFEVGASGRVSNRIWRSLTPIEEDEGAGGGKRGYWLRQGKDDTYYVPILF